MGLLGAEGGGSIVPIFAQDMGFTQQSWRHWARQHLEASFHVYIHIDHKSRWKQALALAACPLLLFMHLTNPSMHIGQPPPSSLGLLYLRTCTGMHTHH